jgi:hypothetical protein
MATKVWAGRGDGGGVRVDLGEDGCVCYVLSDAYSGPGFPWGHDRHRVYYWTPRHGWVRKTLVRGETATGGYDDDDDFSPAYDVVEPETAAEDFRRHGRPFPKTPGRLGGKRDRFVRPVHRDELIRALRNAGMTYPKIKVVLAELGFETVTDQALGKAARRLDP